MSFILVTGGTGKTGGRLVQRLIEEGHKVRVASRSGSAPQGAEGLAFDWNSGVNDAAAIEGIDGVYLVAPVGVADVHTPMTRLVDAALERGVKRFVLLSASSVEEGGPAMGSVHAYLKDKAPEWAVLRPSWFMQNFSVGQHLPTIREEDAIYSATDEGRIAFIDSDDIAEVGLRALLDNVPQNRDLIITGPKALTYGEAGDMIGAARGKAVHHIKLTTAQLAQRWEEFGLEPQYAQILAAMDEAIANGAEDRTTDLVELVTGRPPKSLEQFIEENSSVWKV
ncbi:MAG: ergot alkaloid biosynthesis protein [Sphingomonadales bacterium]|nr:MAG: ergot alkaloid biosynthesis protein [Sphingomonadales bacterium]TNF03733.1 MAG: ergot alkaloid biosynthesis protein [Sphingomonadales bacterium]